MSDSAPTDAFHEENRQRVLEATRLLDSLPEAAFDRLTQVAAGLLGAPVALISLVDRHRQFFKSMFGMSEPWVSRRETPLSHSFCQYVVRDRAPLVVNDAREHAVLKDNLAVRDLDVIAYAGVPLIVEDEAIGAFCIVDNKPREWTVEQLKLLRYLADSVVSEIQLRMALSEASEQRALLRAVVESMGDAVLAIDKSRKFLVANESARRLFGTFNADGVAPGRQLGPEWTTVARATRADGTPLPPEEAALPRAIRGEKTDRLEYTLEVPGAASPVWVEASGRPVRAEGGEVVAAVAVYRDVTERRAHEAVLQRHAKELEAAAVTDELTGLLNRRGFFLVGEQQVKIAARTRRALTVFFIDLNGMKTINDTLGHKMGDRALLDTAAILRRVFRESDVIARLGGDEFVVLATDAVVASEVFVTDRLMVTLADYNGPGAPFELSLSVGTASFDPDHPVHLERLVADADARMYEVKRSVRPESGRVRAATPTPSR